MEPRLTGQRHATAEQARILFDYAEHLRTGRDRRRALLYARRLAPPSVSP